jgi:hypothetical protein
MNIASFPEPARIHLGPHPLPPQRRPSPLRRPHVTGQPPHPERGRSVAERAGTAAAEDRIDGRDGPRQPSVRRSGWLRNGSVRSPPSHARETVYGDDTFRSLPTTGAAGRLTAAGVVNGASGRGRPQASANRRSFMMPRASARWPGSPLAGCGIRCLSVATTRRGRATAAHALNTRLLGEIVRPRGEGTRMAVVSPIRGID